MGFSISTPFGGMSHQKDPKSFRNPGSIEDPIQSLQNLMISLSRLGQGLSEKGPSRLHSLTPQGGPSKPVSIPGLAMQIGGGLGTDPTVQTQQLAQGNPFKYAPFEAASGPTGPPMDQMMNPVQRRKPSNG